MISAQEPGRSLRALIVTADDVVSPAHGGGTKRTWNLIRGFERNGIATTLWSSHPPVYLDRPSPLPADMSPTRVFRGRPRRSVTDKFRALASSLPEDVWQRPIKPGADWIAELSHCDVVVLMQPHAGQLLPYARAAGLPVAIDMHDVVDQATAAIAQMMPTRVARWRTRLDAAKWARFQPRLLQRASLVVAVSEPDAAALRRAAGEIPVVVRPNGVDVDEYDFRDHAAVRGSRLLMTGHFAYWPNIDAATWLTTEILPALRARRTEVTLKLVGRAAPVGPLPDGITSERNVPDIRPYFDQADVFTVPLRAGGGTRLKLLEAFAKGLPAVSTTIGCEGLPVDDGVHLLIADTAEALVEATLRLLDEPELRVRLAANARKLVEEQFDWETITADYASDLRSLASS